MKNVLFVCSMNQLRSPTAEQVFADYPGVTTSSAGTNHDAINPVTPELLEWANIIFVMEEHHRDKLRKKFLPHLAHAKIICLNINDLYRYMEPALIEVLKQKVTPYL